MFSYLKRIDLFLLISDLGNLDLLKMTGRGKGKGAPVFDFIALGMYNENNIGAPKMRNFLVHSLPLYSVYVFLSI